jgi:pectinesterase
MMRSYLNALGACIVSAALSVGTAPLGAQVTVRVENSLSFLREGEIVSVPWSAVRQALPGASDKTIRVVDPASGREVVSQAVDDDGNGRIDELIFQATFAPGEVKSFRLDPSAPSARPAKALVHVTHTMPRDDMAWESDRIAFRMYGQGLWKVDSLFSSGIDVWVKSVRDPIVEKWYAKGHDSYHRDTGEGADFFDVGETLGAGGTAIWQNGKLYRAANFKSYRIIADGPVRAIFEVKYDPWTAPNGLRVSEVKRISIDAGQNLNRVVSTFRAEGSPAPAGGIPFAIGLVKRKNVVGSANKSQPWAWLSEWGPVDPKNGGHGELGLALLLPRDRIEEWQEISDHYLAVSHAQSDVPVVYYIGAGWTDSGDFRDVRDWWSYLSHFAERIESPLKVTVSGSR